MRSWHQTLGAGLDSWVLREHELPQPGPREVQLRVHATGLNFREIAIAKLGRYPLPVKPDGVALCDGAGQVVACGDGVTRWRPGDRVVASIFPQWMDGPFSLEVSAQLGGSLDGLLTEYVVLHEEALLRIPPHLSYEEAAAMPCVAATAWNALSGGRPLQAGDDVLTLGSGAVSLVALLLAKAAGARVIATTSSESKAERLRALGADEVLDYRRDPEWSAQVRRLTGGRGVNRVVEVGGAASLAQSLRSVALSGEIAFVGTMGGGNSMIDANLVFASGAALRPVAAGSRAQLGAALRVFELHDLRPPLAQAFAFDEARAALASYAKGDSFGKTVIRVAT